MQAANGRPADGLLGRPLLQAVVDAQERRDGTFLIQLLQDKDPAVRARAAFALGSVQDDAAVPMLIRALKDGDPRVRADAAFALGQSADSTVAPALLRSLEHEVDPATTSLLLEALGKIGGADAIHALASLEPVRGRPAERALALARFAMRGVHEPAATVVLLRLLDHDAPDVRMAAAYAFARPEDPAFWRGYANRLRAAFATWGPDDSAAAYLAAALARLEDPEDTPLLLQVLREALDWRARVNAARALASRTEAREVRDALRLAAEDPSHHVRRVAGEALSSTRHADSTDAIALSDQLRGLEDPAAAAALLPALIRAGAEAAAVAWVAQLPAEAVPARASALRGFGSATGEGSRRMLEEALHSENPRLAAAAVEALAERWRARRSEQRATIFYPWFRDALLRDDPAISLIAADALSDSLFLPLGSVELLRGASASPHGGIAAAAREALARVAGETASAGGSLADLAPPAVDWTELARLGRHPLVVLETERGRIVLRLVAEQAPLTVQRLAEVASRGDYDGVPFHRVVPNFVIQGGDIVRGDGHGDPGFVLRSELTRIPFRRGTVGMASAGKDTEGSQYFITHAMQPHLDGRYTAFGVVVEGVDVVDRIRPGDRVLRAWVSPDPSSGR